MQELEELKKNPPKFKDGHLLLSGDKYFYTVQGEGPSIGVPSLFIRLHMCNLECDWSKSGGEICDAWYTWKKDTSAYWSEHLLVSFEELMKVIEKHSLAEKIVFTGGEPLMQQKQLNSFLSSYSKDIFENFDVEIETNGTYSIIEEGILWKKILLGRVQINCSPKLSNSGNVNAIKKEVLEQYNQLPNTYFKFVISTHKDIEEIQQLVKDCGLFKDKIILMPEGTSLNRISGFSMESLIQLALFEGWRVTPRLQCEVWGNKRGV